MSHFYATILSKRYNDVVTVFALDKNAAI